MASLTADECNHIVSEFRSQSRLIFQNPNVHGLVVGLRDGVPVLTLLVLKKLPSDRVGLDERMPAFFEYDYEDQRRRIETEVKEAPIARAHSTESSAVTVNNKVRAGESAAGVDLAGTGTAGWNILLNNVPVCVSNWHVLCGLGNATPIGRRVLMASRDIASLYTFQPIYFGAVNQWDYALAQYDSLASVAGSYRPCEDGSVKPYPRRLSSPSSVHIGASYHKVGNRRPICRSGSLAGVGFRTISYGEGQFASFEKQLIFTEMSGRGDSGSIIVNSADNSVTGLNFAGSEEESETIANPFYLNPWTPTGRFITIDDEEIPAFIGNPNLTGLESTLAPQPVASLSPFSQRVVGDRLVPFDDLPGFSAGKLFLNSGRGVVDFTARRVVQMPPMPAPIRSNVSVEAVIGGLDVSVPPNWNNPVRINVIFLFFG